MPHVLLQAGHQNIERNCDTELARGTGAPGEKLWTPVIRAKVSHLLQAHGFKVENADANLNCLPPGPVHGPYDLTLAIHYQSDNPSHTSSGFGVFVPDPLVDRYNARSIALAKPIAKIYQERTGLTNYSSPRLGFGPVTWENPNTKFYYLWNNQEGPLALIECGVGAVGAKDHALLWGKQDLIASAIAEGICVAFGVKWAPVPVPVPPAPVPVPFPPPVPVPEPPPVIPPVVNPPPVNPPVNPPVITPVDTQASFIKWFFEAIKAILAGQPVPPRP